MELELAVPALPQVATQRAAFLQRGIHLRLEEATRAAPSTFALYSAMSAFLSSVSGSSPSLRGEAMPMLAPMRTW